MKNTGKQNAVGDKVQVRNVPVLSEITRFEGAHGVWLWSVTGGEFFAWRNEIV